MEGAGMPVVCSAMWLHPRRPEVDLFLLVLQVSGIAIALIGCQREQWLQRRRR